MYQPPRREPEIDLEQILQRVRAFMRRFAGGPRLGGSGVIAYVVWGIFLFAFIIWMVTGIFTVDPGEQGIKRTFGKFTSVVDEGLHWHWPNPIGTTRVVSVEQTRSMELGFRSVDGGAATPFQNEARMITGDLNVVDAQLVVQYNISNLEDFLFKVADPGDPDRAGVIEVDTPEGRTLKDATEAALRLVVGQRAVDAVRTTQRDQVQADTQEELQQILDSYGAGIQVLAVRLQDVVPPEEVKDAFDDVLRARQEKDTAINLAEAFEKDRIPRAEGQAARITEEAEGFKQQRINLAKGQADRFESVLTEYNQAKAVTRQRLYLEAMEEILPNLNIIVVSPEAGGGIILNASGQAIVPVPELAPPAISTPSPAP